MAPSQSTAVSGCFKGYPQNMPRGRDSRHALSELSTQLENNEDDLFDPDSGREWGFLEVYDNDGYEDAECKDRQELEAHLSRRGTDPRCRLVFIQSEHSAAALDGSKDMMKYLLWHHEVMPSFLRLLANWAIPPVDPSDPHCFHKAAFHHENVLTHDGAKTYRTAMGRSGLQIRHCYSIWGTEKDEEGIWRIRQTTLYHSLDVVTGKALWVNVKTNEIMKKRMSAVAREEPSPEASSSAREKSIVALANSLEMHALAAEWCSQDWGVCIQSVEKELRAILDKLKNLPVTEVERCLEVDAGALIQDFEPTTRVRRQASSFYSTRPSGHHPLAADARSPTWIPLSPLGPRGQPKTQSAAPTPKAPDPFRVIREFNFKGLQRLETLATKLQQFSHTMQLNCRIMSQLDAYYTSLKSDRGFPAHIKRACSHHLDEFHQRLQACIRAMELERERVANLLVVAEDGKRLYDVVMQLRYMETSKLFAVAAHQMTREMQVVGEKTKRETTSMHIITAVTLFFLPGTFVATFLGSGMFQWDQDDKNMQFPSWRPEYFKLFVYISVTMMVLILAVWLGLYLRTRRTRIGGRNHKAGSV
ncbi:hypothetical protein GGTG_10626 [Gaeumannomyces tritici R3-111a-1]|uniref:CorA-like transporter domain-containing protein n=1 Tax=Gaeumannomyces tritici (strain R3-111a-1) TaxID=644352 RepID=J3PAV1_GAET3|nr:hypothetical protein GGTG_10626 [Gaeumannomyces tritici R3-111a-1]EJT71367.1 hypothetical protein GGTG_10626 [Gaeumannomyces tritici R3-111a-1]